MLKFAKKSKLMIGVLIIILAMPFLVWGLTEYSNFHTLFSKNPSIWIGFFGSYTGAIAGGYITLLVMDETIKNGDANLEKSINENKILQQRNEKVEFCNELSSIISNYCSETDKFIKFTHISKGAKVDLENHKKYLEIAENELNEAELKFKDIRYSKTPVKSGENLIQMLHTAMNTISEKQSLVSELKSLYDSANLELKTNLEKANSIDISSLYFLLKIKLKNIEESKNLLKLISDIYSSYILYIDSSNLDYVQLKYNQVNQLLNETTQFIDSYINKL